jgi:hypothetical protein
MAKYRVNSQLFYSGKTAEVGDVVSDLPSNDIKWLVERGDIELVKNDKKITTHQLDEVEEGDDD